MRRRRVGVALEGAECCRAAALGVVRTAVEAIDTLRTAAFIARVAGMVALRLVTALANTNLLTSTTCKLIALLLQQVALLTARVVTRVVRRLKV